MRRQALWSRSLLTIINRWAHRYLADEEALLLLAILLICGAVLATIGGIVAPIIISVILAFVMQGVSKLLGRYSVPDRVAIAITYLLFLGASFAFFVFIIPRVWRQMVSLYAELPTLIVRVQELVTRFNDSFPGLIGAEQVASLTRLFESGAGDMGQWLVSFSLSKLPAVVSFTVYLLIVPILVFFFLKDRDQILAWCVGFLPSERPLLDRIGAEMNEQMANYVRGKVIEIIITGGATYIVFQIFGLNYAALLAFLVGLSVIIPYLGIAVVSVPIVLISYLQFGPSSDFLYMMAFYTVVQVLDGLVLVPILFSEVVNLHPVAIIVSVIVFGSLWGLSGVFFAIPLATLIRAVLAAWPRREALS